MRCRSWCLYSSCFLCRYLLFWCCVKFRLSFGKVALQPLVSGRRGLVVTVRSYALMGSEGWGLGWGMGVRTGHICSGPWGHHSDQGEHVNSRPLICFLWRCTVAPGPKFHVSIQLSPTMSSYPAQGFLAKTYMVVVDTVEISRGNRLGTVQDRAQWPKFRILSPKAHKICNRR